MQKDQQKLAQLIQGKKVAFIGAGVSHKTLIKEFVELGAHVTLCDQKKSVDEFCKLLLIFLHKERTSSMKIQAEIDSLLHFTPFPANWQRQTLFWPRMHRNPI